MTSAERIMTLHPQGKKGVHIVKSKYQLIKNFILETVAEYEVITYQELNDLAIEKLSDTFEGKVGWYVVSVKLDLEARGILQRVPKTSPHQLKLKER